MTVVFIGLLVFILGAVFVVNTGFLGQYYVSHKVQDLLDAYASVSTVLEQGSLSEQSTEILYEAEKANIDLAIVNSNAETLLSTAKDGSQLFIQLFMNLYGRNEVPSTILEQTDNYILCRTTNPDDMDYLEMWGEFSDGSFFMMRSPLESIRESAALANQFLIYLGLTGIILGGVLVWLFARRITRPNRPQPVTPFSGPGQSPPASSPNTSEVFPAPEGPVTVVIPPAGKLTCRSRRLFFRAPKTRIGSPAPERRREVTVQVRVSHRPVIEAGTAAICSGVPCATTRPPCRPAPGPRSTM